MDIENYLIFFILIIYLVSFIIIFTVYFNIKQSKNIILISPQENQIFQRNNNNESEIIISGYLNNIFDYDLTLEYQINNNNWIKFSSNYSINFIEKIILKSGWYNLNIRVIKNNKIILNKSIKKFGIGEVFIVSGQSNSANWADSKLKISSNNIYSFDGKKWNLANDPQIGANGKGGSFIPPLGDFLFNNLNIPIGFSSCGVGNTSIVEWTPKDTEVPYWNSNYTKSKKLKNGNYLSNGLLYDKLVSRIKYFGKNGFRAILWIQGESDSLFKDTNNKSLSLIGKDKYYELLKLIIEDTRIQINCNINWFVSNTTYVYGNLMDDIRNAQSLIWLNNIAFKGPDTDTLGKNFRSSKDNVHLNKEGQIEMAKLWGNLLLPWINSNPNLC